MDQSGNQSGDERSSAMDGERRAPQAPQGNQVDPEDEGQTRIFVANLPRTWKEQDVRDFLCKFGKLDKVYMVPNFHTKEFQGQVKVSFTDVEDPEKLIENIKSEKVNGVDLRVEHAYSKEQTRKRKSQFREQDRKEEYYRRYRDNYYDNDPYSYRDPRYRESSYYDRYDDRDYYRDPRMRDYQDDYRRREDVYRRDYRDMRDYPRSRRDDYR